MESYSPFCWLAHINNSHRFQRDWLELSENHLCAKFEMDWSFKVSLESSAHKKGLVLPLCTGVNQPAPRGKDILIVSAGHSVQTAPVQQPSLLLTSGSKSPLRCVCSTKRFKLTKWQKEGGSSSAVAWWGLYYYHLQVSDACWNIWNTQPRSARELLKPRLDLNSDPSLREMPGNPDPHPRYLAWTQKTFN